MVEVKDMIPSMNTRMYRPRSVTIGMRQQASFRSGQILTKRMKKPLLLVLAAALVIVFAVSQFMHWRIANADGRLQQLQVVRTDRGSENIKLLAQRAHLMSEQHITTVAAVKFDLQPPGEGQVKRL